MTALPTGLTTGTWNVDPSHTRAEFTVRHAGISKVRGSVPVTGGTLTVGEELESSSVVVTLDPSGVTTGDDTRDGHLRSADFFDTDTFGEWTFTSTSVKASGDEYVVAGDLTIHGVTRPVELTTEFNGQAVDPFGNTRAGFEATVVICRKDFGLTWNAALEAGGVLVGDKVTIDLDVSAIKA